MALKAQVINVDGTSAGGIYTISNYPGNFVSYYDGFSVVFRSNHTCPANPTLAIGGGGPRPVVNTAGNPLSAGDIQLGQVVTVIYDNVNSEFQMITASGNVGGGGSPWTDGGTTIYPTNSGDFVGIGVVPTEKFEVAGTAKIISANDPLIIRATADGFGVRIREADDGNDAIGLYGYSGRGRIFLKNNGVNAVDIEASGNSFFNGGNVGIGINAPLSRLHVAANAQNGIVTQVSSVGNHPYHAFYRSRGTIGAETGVFNNDILGGIIFMSNDGSSPVDAAYIRAKATENHGIGRGSELQFYTTTNTSGSPNIKMTIANNGNVGIGTGFNSPLQRLTVDGNFGIIETGATPSFHSVFAGGDQTDDIFYTLPLAQAVGTSLLQNDGSGNLSWVAGGGGIAGGGTLNNVPKFTPDGSTLGNSQIYDDGTKINISGDNSDALYKFTIGKNASSIEKVLAFTNTNSIDGAGTSIGFRSLFIATLWDQARISGVTSNGISQGSLIFETMNNRATSTMIEAMRITGAGNVGIGTSVPLLRLDARSANGKSAAFVFENLFQVASNEAAGPLALRMGIQTSATATSRYGAIEVDDNGTKRKLELQPNGGDVGIGTLSGTGGSFSVNGPSVSLNNPSGSMSVTIGGSLINASSVSVDGSVTIHNTGQYYYSAAKSCTTRIPAPEFVGGSIGGSLAASYVPIYQSNGNFVNFNTQGTAGSVANLTAPLILPDGATITSFDARVYDNDATAGYDITVALYRGLANVGTAGSTTTLATVTTSATLATIQNLTSGFIGDAISYTNQHYFFNVTLRQNNPNLRLYTIIVYYTVTKTD